MGYNGYDAHRGNHVVDERRKYNDRFFEFLCKPYIRDHLSKYPEFSHTDKGDYKSPEEMAARIEVLEDRLSKSVNRNKELLAEIQKIRAESAIKYKQLQLDYERLAGAYQKETEKKIIRL